MERLGVKLKGRHFETGEPIEVTVAGKTIAAVGAAPDEQPSTDNRALAQQGRRASGGAGQGEAGTRGVTQGVRVGRETAQTPDVLGDDGYWIAPALFDSQINGFGGRNLNAEDTSPDDVAAVVRFLWESGVARFCPTVTTNSFQNMAHSLAAIRQACEQNAHVNHASVTFHIEGPYISSEDGPRGAHPREHTRPPDLDEFRRLQEAAGGRIGYVTLAPELPGAPAFVEQLAADGIVVSLGHHGASGEAIRAAVDGGARHCTHLGNGAHAQLPRHPNYLWEQLAEDRLTAGIIADGHHLPPAVVKSFVRGKQLERTVLVSDAIAAAGLPPGRYRGNKGQMLEIAPNGRIGVADTPYLAGSGLRLHQGIGNAVRFAGISLAESIRLATENPARVFGIADRYGRLEPGQSADLLLFRWDEAAQEVHVAATMAAGEVVYRGGA